jgi:hypothetical protein
MAEGPAAFAPDPAPGYPAAVIPVAHTTACEESVA